MSKLYDLYLNLKKQNNKTIYLFKSGIFFIALDEDANTLSNIFNLKLGYLTPTITKCGFPINSLNKYLNLFNVHNLDVKLVDSNTLYKIKDYKQTEDVKQLIKLINSVEIDNLSVAEAYTFIQDLQTNTKNINL